MIFLLTLILISQRTSLPFPRTAQGERVVAVVDVFKHYLLIYLWTLFIEIWRDQVLKRINTKDDIGV